MQLNFFRACLGQMFLSVHPVWLVGYLCWAHYIVLVVSGVFVLHLLMVIISAGVHTDSLGASRRYLGHTGNHCEV